MARKRKPHPTEPLYWGASGPTFYPPWREEFNSRASWGKHPESNPFSGQKHDGDYGPSNMQGYERREHPGDD